MRTIFQAEGNFQFLNLIAIVVLTILGITILTMIPPIRADTTNPGVYAIGSKPSGLTYGDWTVKWWKWIFGIPKDTSPAIDTNGKNCAQGQNDPHVWFLAGTNGGSAERTCVIPLGK